MSLAKELEKLCLAKSDGTFWDVNGTKRTPADMEEEAKQRASRLSWGPDRNLTEQAEAAPDSEEELRKRLKPVFDAVDRDGSGTLSCEEVFDMCVEINLGMNDDELADLIRQTDADNSGEIEFEEFMDALKDHLHVRRKGRAHTPCRTAHGITASCMASIVPNPH